MTSRRIPALALPFSKPISPLIRAPQVCVPSFRSQRLRPQARPRPQFYSSAPPPTPKSYTYSTLQPLTLSPSPSRIIIDVRELAELEETGRIPGAKSMPITSNPEAIFLPSDEFEEKFGFEKPGSEEREEGKNANTGKERSEEKEVIFYCKAGVRSRAAARMAGMDGGWRGVKIGELPGGWLEWEKNGGSIER